MFIVRKLYSILIDLIETLVIAGAIFVVIYAFLFRPFQVNGQSMHPTYKHGEYILTSLISLNLEDPKRGDVVVFESPVSEEKDFVKRVIGLPGESIKLQDGYVFIDGIRLDESSYLPQSVRTYGGSFIAEGAEISIPEESYFVLGDNRSFSSDSREWGLVNENNLIGKSLIVYWPLNNLHIIQGIDYEL